MNGDRDAAAALVAVVASAWWATTSRAGAPALLLTALVASAVAVAVRAVRAAGGRRLAATGLAVVALAGGAAITGLRARAGVDATFAARHSGRYAATATLATDPVRFRFSARAVARLTHLTPLEPAGAPGGGRAAVNRRVLLVASGDATSRLAVLDAGDTIDVAGTVLALRPNERRYRWQHCAARFAITDVLALRGPSSPLARVSGRARGAVLAGTRSLPGDARAIVRAFVLGDTRELPDRTSTEFRRAGMSHLLVVSGANVAFVLALVQPLLRRASLRGRFIGGATTLVVFGAMTRWQPSVLRAVAMALVMLSAAWLGRPASAGRVLCLAVTALVVADPFLVHSVGFALSCGACMGIVVLSRPIAVRLRGPRWLRDTLAVTAAAQCGVAPVLFPVFGSIPLVALPANLAAAPLVGPLTMTGLAGAAAARALHPVAPTLAELVQVPAAALARALATLAAVAARQPLALTPTRLAAAVMVGSAAGSAAVVVRGRSRRRGAVRSSSAWNCASERIESTSPTASS